MATELGLQYRELKQAFNTPKPDLKKMGIILAKLKVGLAGAGLLVPQEDVNYQDFVVARDILEIGAFWSIRTKDVPAFDRYFSQLQTFYNDYSSVLPPSPREYPLRGLNLIHLLTQNRIADFHTTLESLPLPADSLASNPFISHPINLERWLMEGSYSKVWNARLEAPADEYRFFVDSLMGTIRNEIASCLEAAYDSLPIKDFTTLIFFETEREAVAYAQKRNWEVDLVNKKISFSKKGEEKLEIPKQKLITANLAYARELEQIV